MDNPAAIPPGRIRLLPYFRIIWGAKEAVRGNWYLGLLGFHTKGYPRELWIYLSLRGFLRWSAGTLIVTYFAGAAALTWFFSRNPYNKITYTDLILPSQWSELRKLRGEANIEEGLAKLKAGQYVPAFMLLNQGLARKPDNVSARLVVAQMYAGMGYFKRAMTVYNDGLAYAGDHRLFVTAALELAEYMEDYNSVLALINQIESTPDIELRSVRSLLRDKRLTAYEKMGRYDDIDALWLANRSAPTMRLNAAHLRSLSAKGRANEAINLLESNPGQYGILRHPWELLLELSRSNQRQDTARRALDALVAVEPNHYFFHASRIAYLAEIGAEEEAKRRIRDFFLQFGGDSNAAVALLKETGKYCTLSLNFFIWQEIQTHGLAGPMAHIAYVQNMIQLADIDEAKRAFADTQKYLRLTNYADKGWIEGTSLLLELMQNDSPSTRDSLYRFIVKQRFSPENYRLIIPHLLRTGRLTAAREVAALARNRFPFIRDLPAIPDEDPITPINAPQLQATLPSPTPAITEARDSKFELAATDESIKTEKWEEALLHIQRFEAAVTAREQAMDAPYRYVIIHGHLGNLTELQWYMRRLLEADRPESNKLRALSNQLYNTGRQSSAVTILQEVLRKHPSAKWASDQLAAWKPKT